MQVRIMIFYITFVLLCLVSVRGAVTSPDWMIYPGEDGKPYIAVLNGPIPLPRDIDPIRDVTFHLYTRENSSTPVQVFVNDINGANFNPSKPTKVIVHGFTSDAFVDWSLNFKTNFLLNDECNILAVDWSELASGPLYNFARGYVRPTGEYLAEMLDFLSELGLNPSDIHCVGHSLGAHVCGFAGKAVKRGNIGRITGLDPAKPLFDLDEPNERLAKSDATYVDIVHTCAGWLGFRDPIGHADFYPNGGEDQPGCGIDFTGSCSHGRAHTFFAESIISENFNSHHCDSWKNFINNHCTERTQDLMGNPSNASSRGTFYLATARTSPFALGPK